MGTALLELERLDDAVASYRKTLVIKPDYAEAHCKMGNALMKLLWLDDAIASYQKALVIEPDYAEALNNLGKALQDLGQVEDAVANFRKALAVNPDSSVGNYNLGLALQELGQLDEAAERFNRASELKPDFAEAHRQLGNTLLIMGNLPSAINAYRLVVETRPDDSDLSLFFMGVIHDLLGETEHATGLFDRIHSDYKNSNHMVDSWKYANRHEVESTPLFSTRRDTLALALEHATVEGMMLEFGVSFGTSLKYIASMTDQPVHGFDSFEGLPEDWESIPADSFSTRGRLPDVPPNVQLHAGLFDRTLPGFAAKNSGPICFMNIDCDLYSSTKTVFDHLGESVVTGTVIVFDEYFMTSTWRQHEYKAFQEAVTEYKWRYEYIAFNLLTRQVVVKIV